MKYLFTAALIAGTVAGLGGAHAEGGCGPGWHRNPYGVSAERRGGGCRASSGRRGTWSGCGGSPSRLPDRFCLGLWPLPSDLIAHAIAHIKQPRPPAGFLFGPVRSRVTQA